MIVKCNHPIWVNIWESIRDNYYSPPMSNREFENMLFENENISIIRDHDGRWEEIRLPNDLDLILLLLKHGK